MERRFDGAQGAVDLVSRNMMKAMSGGELCVNPNGLGSLEQRVSANDVSADEIIRSQDRAIDVRLGGKVRQRVDGMRLEQRTHIFLVANIPARTRIGD